MRSNQASMRPQEPSAARRTGHQHATVNASREVNGVERYRHAHPREHGVIEQGDEDEEIEACYLVFPSWPWAPGKFRQDLILVRAIRSIRHFAGASLRPGAAPRRRPVVRHVLGLRVPESRRSPRDVRGSIEEELAQLAQPISWAHAGKGSRRAANIAPSAKAG